MELAELKALVKEKEKELKVLKKELHERELNGKYFDYTLIVYYKIKDKNEWYELRHKKINGSKERLNSLINGWKRIVEKYNDTKYRLIDNRTGEVVIEIE